MILGSLLVGLKPPALLVLTVVLAVGTELLVPSPVAWGQRNSPFDLLLLLSGGDSRLWSNYPVLPWLKFVTFGMLFGHSATSARAWAIVGSPSSTWSNTRPASPSAS